MAKHIKRYIITGAPGTGKTSVINALRKKEYSCFNEVSRELILEQQRSGGQLFPWGNLSGFADECSKRMNRQCDKALPGINFFDRAIPDNMAYLKSLNIAVDNYHYFQTGQYEKEVFYFPIWPEIFVNDPQRPETIERAQELDYFLRRTYIQLNFNLIEIELTNIKQRVILIEHIVNQK